MTNQGIWIGLVVLAVMASFWFRRHPMSDGQRKIAVVIAIVLMATAFLRERQLNLGSISLVVFGAVVLILALVYLQRQNRTPD